MNEPFRMKSIVTLSRVLLRLHQYVKQTAETYALGNYIDNVTYNNHSKLVTSQLTTFNVLWHLSTTTKAGKITIFHSIYWQKYSCIKPIITNYISSLLNYSWLYIGHNVVYTMTKTYTWYSLDTEVKYRESSGVQIWCLKWKETKFNTEYI